MTINQSMIADDAAIIQTTKKWVNSFVIEYNLCPFAKRVMDNDSVKFQVIHANTFDTALEAFMSAIFELDKNQQIETALLVFPSILSDFYTYLDFAELAETLLFEQGYEGIYQCATFHPDYCFADVNTEDVSNYTNRSPYPMLHLLRETSLDAAISYYGNTEQIPENNIKTLRDLGLKKIKKVWV